MEYTEDMLTEWFDTNKTKPTEVGVYPVQLFQKFADTTNPVRCNLGWYAYWDGREFKSASSEKKVAESNKCDKEKYGLIAAKWRGLKQNQSTPKKRPSGNKKKTMWIVSAWVNRGETYKHVGAFENHGNAVNAAKRYKQPRINKVRFRTPEA